MRATTAYTRMHTHAHVQNHADMHRHAALPALPPRVLYLEEEEAPGEDHVLDVPPAPPVGAPQRHRVGVPGPRHPREAHELALLVCRRDKGG
jgi:hypothetical protein